MLHCSLLNCFSFLSGYFASEKGKMNPALTMFFSGSSTIIFLLGNALCQYLPNKKQNKQKQGFNIAWNMIFIWHWVLWLIQQLYQHRRCSSSLRGVHSIQSNFLLRLSLSAFNWVLTFPSLRTLVNEIWWYRLGQQKMTNIDNGPGPGRNYGETAVFTVCKKAEKGQKSVFFLLSNTRNQLKEWL